MFFNGNDSYLNESQEFNFLFEDETDKFENLSHEFDLFSEESVAFMYESQIEYLEIEKLGIYNEACAIQSGNQDLVLKEESETWRRIKDWFRKIWNWIKATFNKFTSWIKTFVGNGVKYVKANAEEWDKISDTIKTEVAGKYKVPAKLIDNDGGPINISTELDSFKTQADKLASFSANTYSTQKAALGGEKKFDELETAANDYLNKAKEEKILPMINKAAVLANNMIDAAKLSHTVSSHYAKMIEMVANRGLSYKDDKEVDNDATTALRKLASALMKIFNSVSKDYGNLEKTYLNYFRAVFARRNETKRKEGEY